MISQLSNELNKLRRNLWNTQQAYEVERVKCQKLRHELQTHDKVNNILGIYQIYDFLYSSINLFEYFMCKCLYLIEYIYQIRIQILFFIIIQYRYKY